MSEVLTITKERKEYSVVGKELPRIDGIDKVTARVQYVHDVRLPNMLWAKILRSPHAHAWIKRIDTRKAEQLPGVKAVMTANDIPNVMLGTTHPFLDKAPLARDKVRYVGDEVAAVAAINEETAEKATKLIEVEYEPLPHVLDPEEAMKQGAPLVHDGLNNNIVLSYHNELGSLEQGLKEADYVFEERFTTPQQAHACMETHGCVAICDKEDNITVWASTQIPHTFRMLLAKFLKIPQSKIAVKKVSVGGGFGGKSEVYSYDLICIFLAKKTGRPVKIIFSREEEFLGTTTRHPIVFELKTGVRKDGTIAASYIKSIHDTGAYASQGPGVVLCTVMKGGLHYRIPNYKYDSYCVYTNRPIGGAYRAPGGAQMTFAFESHLDMIAKKLGIDPVEIRLRNAVRQGETSLIGTKFVSCGLTECIEKAVSAIDWYKKKAEKRANRGLGIACTWMECGFRGFIGDTDMSSAFVKVQADGSVEVLTGGPDIGTGFQTAMAQIAAEELGVDYKDVRVTTSDTDSTPFDIGEVGNRSTFI